MKENDQKCEPPRTQITDPTDQWCPQLGTWQNTVLQMFFLGVLLSACERCIQEQGRPRVLKQVCLGVARYRRAVFCIGDGFCNLPWRQFPWTRAALLPKIRSTFITAGDGWRGVRGLPWDGSLIHKHRYLYILPCPHIISK